MKIERFENRIVFDANLGDPIQFEIDTTVEVEIAPQPEPEELPTDIQFRPVDDDFRYESEDLDPQLLDRLMSTTEGWAANPQGHYLLEMTEETGFRKPGGYYAPEIHPDGHLIARRMEDQNDSHNMLVVRQVSDDYLISGSYMKQDHHYRFSFDVRHPESELSWLQQKHWSIVSQMWGPREAGETGRNPPFAIYTQSRDGVPHWVVRSRGDSRRITHTGEFEEYNFVEVPLTNPGEWHHWDVEYVPNPFGTGVVRVWLNGELVADWVDVKSNYYSVFGDDPVGPLNPTFGFYGPAIEDDMEVHFDNIVLETNGVYESSISGRITGTTDLENNTVFATNLETGQRFGTKTGSSGVYSLPVPKGTYTVTAVNQENGHQVDVADVNAAEVTQIVDVDVYVAPPPPNVEELGLTGDLNGDGKTDIINRLADGGWQVTLVGVGDDVHSRFRAPRIYPRDPNYEPGWQPPSEEAPVSEPPTDETPTDETPTDETPTDETPTDETPTDETPTDETPTDETPTDETPTDETPTDETPTDETPTDETPTDETPTDETPTDETPTDETPTDETPTDETPTDETPTDETPTDETPTDETPTDETPTDETPTDETPTDETPTDETPTDETPTDETPTDETPTDETPTDETPTDETPTDPQDPNVGTTYVWTRWAPEIEWTEIFIADFNGDGMDDIAGWAANNGQWWILESTGWAFRSRLWGRWDHKYGWQDMSIGDFNGDGMTDIAARATTNSSWWIGLSDGTRFHNREWGRWTKGVEWNAYVGDFNGDGMDDIMGRALSDGTFWISQSNGTRFHNSHWGKFPIQYDWSMMEVGDYNGDGMDDIMARAASDGTFWIARSTGTKFVNSYYGRLPKSVTTNVTVVDVNGDGQDDIVGRDDFTGVWWVAMTHEGQFWNHRWGAIWSPEGDWLTAAIADFDGDGATDLIGANKETWWFAE